jgi:hypothetical protein
MGFESFRPFTPRPMLHLCYQSNFYLRYPSSFYLSRPIMVREVIAFIYQRRRGRSLG